jgi:intracellular sulfur oxidation DsrE/DsrF family protein
MSISRLAVCFILASSLRATADDGSAKGMKEGKIVYDITEGDGKLLLGRIETVEETRQDLIKQGVTPRFVISFRGGATKLVQTDMEQVKPEDRPYAAKIAAMLAQMGKAPGMESIEQCAVAIRHAGTKAENVVPPLKVVANSYVTLMAYQSRGYAYIRP